MKIQKIMKHTPDFRWDYDIPSDEVLEGLDWSIQKEVTDAFNLHLRCNAQELVKTNESAYAEVNKMLNEATYKELASLIDGNFLKQKIRADELQGVFYKKTVGSTMYFMVPSSEKSDNNIDYLNMVQFDENEWNSIGNDPDLDGNEKARMLLWTGNISLFCSDPSFLYWGYQYILTVLDSSIYPEERQAVIKNPQDRGICCKHLNRVLRVLPFHSSDITTALKQQFG